jgi:hypothetical protein
MILAGSRVGFIDPAILWPMRSAFRDPCASSRHPSQCGGRCERAGRGCRRPAWDRRSVRASARPAVAKSGSWSEPGSDPRRSPTSRGARLTHRSWQTKTQTIRSSVPPQPATIRQCRQLCSNPRASLQPAAKELKQVKLAAGHLRAVRGSDIGRSVQTRRADPRALSAQCSFAQDEQPAEITRRVRETLDD